MTHTLGLISLNRSTVFWSFLSAVLLTQLHQRKTQQNNQKFHLITAHALCRMKSKSRACAVNGTYLKSNLDVSTFTWTFWLSSTQNSTKTASLLSYHRAAACCALRIIRSKQMTSQLHSDLTRPLINMHKWSTLNILTGCSIPSYVKALMALNAYHKTYGI